MKQKKFLLGAFIVSFMAMGMSTFAAEPEAQPDESLEARLVESVASTQDVQIAEPVDPTVVTFDESVAMTSDEAAVMPRSIYGYAAKYTDPRTGSFFVNASGNGNSTGHFQITTHDFSGSPTITAAAYRPDGTFAGQITISGNGTKTISFSNAISGNYEIVYTVVGNVSGWISAWISS